MKHVINKPAETTQVVEKHFNTIRTLNRATKDFNDLNGAKRLNILNNLDGAVAKGVLVGERGWSQ